MPFNPIQTNPLCKDGYTAIIVCISQNCGVKNPFVCANCVSEPCYYDHSECRKQLLQTFIQRLIRHQPKQQQFRQMQKCINRVIETLSQTLQQTRYSFQKWLREYYYSYEVKKIINAINDNRFSTISGTNMYNIYKSTIYPSKEKFKFNHYYNTKSQTIISYIKNISASIAALYLQKPPQLLDNNDSSFDMSKSFENNMTFDIGFKQVRQIKSQTKKAEINWKKLQQQKEINLQNLLKQQCEINIFKQLNFSKTKILRLSNNQITSISWMKGLFFQSLVQLCLDYNNINDISPMQNLFFPNLKGLHLQYNQIQKINSLAKMHMPYVQVINLNYNAIDNIDTLEKCHFEELKKLYLHDNQISNIEALLLLKLKKVPKLELITIEANSLPYKQEQFQRLVAAIENNLPNLHLRVIS